jgi:hypothetical protein
MQSAKQNKTAVKKRDIKEITYPVDNTKCWTLYNLNKKQDVIDGF